MKQIFVVAAALLAGFVGGILGTRVAPSRDQTPLRQVIRARSFELVDEAGQTISYWGMDKGENVVLAFGGHHAMPSGAGRPLSDHSPLSLTDPDNQRAVIGVVDGIPFLKLRGADGKTRVRLLLSIYEKPILLMEDETGPRVSLGVQQSDTPGPQDNDWTLDFYPERARIGMYAVKEGGQTYVLGGFAVNRDKVKYPYNQPK